MGCVSKIGVGYVVVTNGIATNATNVVFGVNPNIWRCLPDEGIALLKIRQAVPTAGAGLPVAIAVPVSSTVSTVTDSNTASSCCYTISDVAVVNPVNEAVIGSSMVNGTERLLYFNKVKGIIRLMDCCTVAAG